MNRAVAGGKRKAIHERTYTARYHGGGRALHPPIWHTTQRWCESSANFGILAAEAPAPYAEAMQTVRRRVIEEGQILSQAVIDSRIFFLRSTV